MAIKLLDDNVINKIAAGEVIERPASVIKELLENSIDAASRNIAVRITGGGLKSIEVSDDGEGISMEELPLAFLRHATSKIEDESDLLQIMSLGFRGEALPSIASVARLDIYSKKEDQDAIHALIEGGKTLDLQYFPGPEGSKIIVSDLFFNIPARKKFLRSPITEGNHAYELVMKYALARPDIAISFSNERRQVFRTPGNGSLQDAVLAIFGRDFLEPLIPVEWDGINSSISGLISPPGVVRANRKRQLFFVNHRPIRSPLLYRALDEGYRGLLLTREQPLVILQFSVLPDSIDVNVHPQKSEVRFQDEKRIFKALCGLLRDTLNVGDYHLQNSLPRNSFPPFRPAAEWKAVGQRIEGQAEIPFVYNKEADRRVEESRGESWLPIYPEGQVASSLYREKESAAFRILGQLWDSYILLEKEQEFYIIDQHAAHERIIYSQLQQYYAAHPQGEMQMLAFPLNLELARKDIELLEKNQELLHELGFELQQAGPNAVFLRGTPASIAGQEREVLFEILELLSEGQGINLKDEAIIKMACKKAVKAGTRLAYQEMNKIIEDLMITEDYGYCPHGRPTIIAWQQADLERMFKR